MRFFLCLLKSVTPKVSLWPFDFQQKNCNRFLRETNRNFPVSGLGVAGVVPTRALRCARIALDFRESLSVPVGICCDFTTIFDKNEPLFSPLWLWRKFFLCLLNARANRFSKKIVKRLGVAALFRRVRRYPGVAVSRLARLIVLP